MSSVEIPSSFLSWRGNCEGDPLSPPVGEAAQGGQAPLTSKSNWIFLLRCRRTIHSYAPRGEPRRGGERLWLHRYPTPVPSFSFLTSMISTEQKNDNNLALPNSFRYDMKGKMVVR
jgi:hypothetical protein